MFIVRGDFPDLLSGDVHLGESSITIWKYPCSPLASLGEV